MDLSTTCIRGLRKWVLGLFIATIASASSAADYAFQISAAGPSWVNTTFAQDQQAEFEGASKLVSIYIRAVGYAEYSIVTSSYVYVVYKDGQIAKLKIVSLRDSRKVKFDKLVPVVPGSAKQLSQFDIPLPEYFLSYDIQVASNFAVIELARAKVPSVTVIQYEVLLNFVFNFGNGCAWSRDGCWNPVEQ
jgi:hypothetical protein